MGKKKRKAAAADAASDHVNAPQSVGKSCLLVWRSQLTRGLPELHHDIISVMNLISAVISAVIPPCSTCRCNESSGGRTFDGFSCEGNFIPTPAFSFTRTAANRAQILVLTVSCDGVGLMRLQVLISLMCLGVQREASVH